MARTSLPAALRRAVLERDQHRCVQCAVAERLEADHVVPVAVGGRDELDNLQTLCHACHRSKTRAERAAGVVRAGHQGPSRRTTSLRLTEGQFALLERAVAAGYAKGLNAVLARLVDEHLPRADG